MLKDHLLMWLQEGNISIPSFLFAHYVEMGLNEKELILLLQLQQFQKEGNHFPTPDEISMRMTISANECTSTLRKLLQKGFLELKEEVSANALLSEKYSLQPLQMKMVEHFLQKQKLQAAETKAVDDRNLYSIFEQEFGRPLSPFEGETLGMWMDDHQDSQVIMAALREAVISGKLNFRYIDRILFEWKKNGVKTVEQAKAYSEKFRSNFKREQPPAPPVPQPKQVSFYNWLEN
ncbi:MAG: DnaD domain-containing protein [Bacillus sp. (in: firmicutes)]